MTTPDPHAQLYAELYADRVLAHGYLFAHRHKDKAPAYQGELIADFHDDEKHGLDLVFRGGAKSTIAEEALIIKAEYREFRYGLVVGSTIERAYQRLHAIRYELETNEKLSTIYGAQRGRIWSTDQIMLASGIMIGALGKGQSLRGIKHLDQRPDFLFGDDLEDWSDVKDPKARDETWRWFMFDLLPALDPRYIARIAATPLDPDALPARLERDGWRTRRIPVWRYDETDPDHQRRISSWPERFPMTKEDAQALARARGLKPAKAERLVSIEEREASNQRNGTMRQYRSEYLCQAQAPEDQAFTKSMFQDIIVSQAPSWHAVYMMFDPARTKGRKSAMTGYAAWSWVGPKLVVWDSWARPLMPNEIVDAIFEADRQLRPTVLGVEEDGLNEWLLQPLRAEQVKRGVTLPLRPEKAPKDKSKFDFIRGLQLWFHAREIEFAKSMPELQAAFMAFPSGLIDAPNALAYAIKMRGGAPIYGEFSGRHVTAGLEPSAREPVYLACHATRTMVTAVLAQLLGGALRVYADWVLEGEPAQVLGQILASARLRAGSGVRLIAPPEHFDAWQTIGLRQAAARIPVTMTKGAAPDRGRSELRTLLKQEIGAMPAVMVSQEARWTLNGFAGGYHHALSRQAVLAPYAVEGPYKTLMEGLESMLSTAFVSAADDDGAERNWRTAPGGKLYESAWPERRR